jgi:hypothetical protein
MAGGRKLAYYEWVIVLLMVLFTANILYQFLLFSEQFELSRPRREGGHIVVGTIHGTTPAQAQLMSQVNAIGTQLVADSQFDTVDTSVFDGRN